MGGILPHSIPGAGGGAGWPGYDCAGNPATALPIGSPERLHVNSQDSALGAGGDANGWKVQLQYQPNPATVGVPLTNDTATMGGWWASGQIGDITPLNVYQGAPNGSYWIRLDTNYAPTYGLNMHGLWYDGVTSQWYFGDAHGQTTLAPVQPGPGGGTWALWLDCNRYLHVFIGTSDNEFTEGTPANGWWQRGQGWTAADGLHVSAQAFADSGNIQGSPPPILTPIGRVSFTAQYNGIPPWVTIHWGASKGTFGNVTYGTETPFLGAGSPTVNQVSCPCTSHPVNTNFGDFYHTFDDHLTLPGRGIPLHFTQTYDSTLGRQNGPLGYGWTDNYNLYLTQESSGAIWVHEEGGTAVSFTPSGSTYTAAPWVLATLTDTGPSGGCPDTLTFVRKQSQQHFLFCKPTSTTAPGQLLSESDRNGYTTSLAYSNGLLSTVTDPEGRSLNFTYTGSLINHVDEVVNGETVKTVRFGYGDGAGNLTDLYDVKGGHSYFTYDGNHQLKTMEDAHQYATNGPLSSGPVVTNVYNADGQVTQQTDAMGRPTGFRYTNNADGTETTTVTDPKGYVTDLTYQNNTLVTKVEGAGTPQQATWQYQYDPATLGVTQVIDPDKHQWNYTYDTNGNLTTSIQPQVTGESGRRTTSYTYNSFNEPLTVTDPRNLVTTYTYDSSGNLTSVSRPAPSGSQPHLAAHAREAGTGSASRANHSGRSLPLHDRRVGPGSIRRYRDHVIPAAPKPTKTPTPRPATSTPTNTPVPPTNTPVPPTSTPTSTSTPTDTPVPTNTPIPTDTPTPTATATSTPLPTPTAEPSYGPSPDCSVSSSIPPSTTNQETVLTYGDPAHPGDVTSITDPDGNVTTVSYDASGNVASVCDPMGNETTYGYDPAGRVISMVSPKGNAAGGTPSDFTSQYTYNAFDEQTSVTDPLQHQTAATYDENGNLSTLTDARQNPPTVYTTDADNELTGIARSDGTALGYSYDANGNLAAEADGLQQTTSYQYDPLNRVETVTDPLQRQTLYSYDGTGNLLTVTLPRTDATGNHLVTTATYDQVNELTGISYSDGSTPNVTYGYDQDGERTSMTDGTGTSSDQFDILNRLSQSTDGAGNTVGYGYDLANNLTSITYPGSVGTVTRSYDPDNRLKSVSDWLGHTTSFGYDPNSNLTSEVYPNSITASYRYNTADQLTWIDDSRNGSPFWSYGYGRDEMGQVQTASDPVASTSHTYGYNQLNQLTSDQQPSGTTSFGYDAADQLTGTSDVSSDSGAQTNTGTEYDAAGELTGWGKTQQNTPSGPINLLANLTLTYNADGDRTGSTDSVSGTSQTFTYDQADELTSYSSGSTSATYRYNGDGLRMSKTVNGTTSNQVWDLAEGLPVIIQDGATDYITGPGGLPIEQVGGDGSVQYYLQDQLGSTRGLTDSSGSIVAAFSYDAYGKLTGSTGTASTPFGYAGQYTDSESGLQYLRARYYDPQTAQFLTVDPLVGLTQQPYAYTSDNPINALDPTGASCGPAWFLPCDQVGNAIGGFIGQVGNAINGRPNPGRSLTPVVARPNPPTPCFGTVTPFPTAPPTVPLYVPTSTPGPLAYRPGPTYTPTPHPVTGPVPTVSPNQALCAQLSGLGEEDGPEEVPLTGPSAFGGFLTVLENTAKTYSCPPQP